VISLERLISDAREFLLERLLDTCDCEEEAMYRYNHSLRVANIGTSLAKKENANESIVNIACILHDVGKFCVLNNEDHGRYSAKIAKEFLLDYNLQETEINDIAYAIAYHTDGNSGYSYVHTCEASVVADADNVDRVSMYAANKYIKEISNLSSTEQTDALEKRIKKLSTFKRLCISTTPDGKIIRPLETKSGCELFKKQVDLKIAIYKAYKRELEGY
jgi:uncharacterized protein